MCTSMSPPTRQVGALSGERIGGLRAFLREEGLLEDPTKALEALEALAKDDPTKAPKMLNALWMDNPRRALKALAKEERVSMRWYAAAFLDELVKVNDYLALAADAAGRLAKRSSRINKAAAEGL